jgi:hypothetical protein
MPPCRRLWTRSGRNATRQVSGAPRRWVDDAVAGRLCAQAFRECLAGRIGDNGGLLGCPIRGAEIVKRTEEVRHALREIGHVLKAADRFEFAG